MHSLVSQYKKAAEKRSVLKDTFFVIKVKYGNRFGCHILVVFSLLLERYFCFTKVILLRRDMRLNHSRREYLCAYHNIFTQ